MSCCHLYEFAGGGESIFAVDPVAIRFGPGALKEAGAEARARAIKRVGVFTDPEVAKLEAVSDRRRLLEAAGIDSDIYREVARVEPTDGRSSRRPASRCEGRFDGFVSVGGGSTIDTCKAANLYATYPADFLAYVNAPIGDGQPVPGPLKPHIACPTTSGTGSESTAIAVFDLVSRHVKTGIAARRASPLAGADRSGRHRNAAGQRRCGQRVRRAEPCAGVVHRRAVYGARGAGPTRACGR